MRKLWEYADFIDQIIALFPWGEQVKVFVLRFDKEDPLNNDNFFILALHDTHDGEMITKTCFIPHAKEEWVREALIRNALIYGCRWLHAGHIRISVRRSKKPMH